MNIVKLFCYYYHGAEFFLYYAHNSGAVLSYYSRGDKRWNASVLGILD